MEGVAVLPMNISGFRRGIWIRGPLVRVSGREAPVEPHSSRAENHPIASRFSLIVRLSMSRKYNWLHCLKGRSQGERHLSVRA